MTLEELKEAILSCLPASVCIDLEPPFKGFHLNLVDYEINFRFREDRKDVVISFDDMDGRPVDHEILSNPENVRAYIRLRVMNVLQTKCNQYKWRTGLYEKLFSAIEGIEQE